MALDFDGKYTPRSNPPDANYPYGSFKNSVTPLTGTPVDKDWANDVLGLLQKLLNYAGITPSGVPDTIVASDYFTALQKLVKSNSQYLVDSGAADAYVGTGAPPYTAYFAGMKIRLKITNANTGAATHNQDSLGAKPIKKNVSEALVADDLPAGFIAELEYDGTNFQLTNHLKRLGAWDYSKVKGTTYLAATDLIVHASTSGTNVDVSAETDGSTPPTTLVANDGSVSTNVGACITFAVKKGNYWLVTCPGTLDQLSVIPFS